MIKFCKENKRLLFITFFATIFVHLIKFVNYYPTWDNIPAIIKPLKAMIGYGRWFSGTAANITSSPYDLQWIEGVSAAVFISFSLVLFLKLFDINNKTYQYLCIATFSTFPSLAATFAYQNWASAYMFALFFAIGAVYLCFNYKGNRIAIIVCATLLLALSLGIYQIYFTFAFLVVLYYIFTKLLTGKQNISDMKSGICNFGISFFSGAIIYWIVNKIVLSLLKSELSDYQGISSIHIPNLKEIFAALESSNKAFSEFFKGDFSFFKGDISVFSFYPIINAIIFILLVVCIIKFVILNKNIKILHKIIMLSILVVTVPVAYAFNFTSSGVIYHRLMEFGNYFVYFLPIIFLQHFKFRFNVIKRLIAGSLLAISMYNFMNANVAYHQMNISYEKTYFQNIEIASMIDSVSDNDKVKVAIIGDSDSGETTLYANPSITGATTSIFTVSQFHTIRFANYYLGRDYIRCDDDTIANIKEKEEFKAMPNFPSKNSVQMIDDVVVVKLSEPNEN